MYLHEKLEEYGKHGRYPMHMPGHKRQLRDDVFSCDITEIDGFDNLHHSEDIIKSDREKAALFYDAGEARFLVNGSTCGVLAAISAVTEYGDTIIIGRNSHKSAYHAIQLRGLWAEYVYPDTSLYGEWSIDGPIPPEEVRRLLEKQEHGCENPSVQGKPKSECMEPSAQRRKKCSAVFLTSPTYEGVISDVQEIAKICHEHGVPLIVDEAHGAHLKVMEVYGTFAQHGGRRTEENSGVDAGVSALEAGADLVILGLHKTMPVLTQGALLAVSREAICEGRVSMKMLDEYLGIYESSSPSYILMGSISRCIHWLDGSYEIEGRKIGESVAAYQKLLEETRRKLGCMKHFRLFPTGGSERNENGKRKCDIVYDPGKIVISTKGTGLTGEWLADRLRERYGVEIEMASADYIVAMTSMFDTEEGMKGFAEAVLECDAAFDPDGVTNSGKIFEKSKEDCHAHELVAARKKMSNATEAFSEKEADISITPEEFPRAEAVMSIAEAVAFVGKYPDKMMEKDISCWAEEKASDEKKSGERLSGKTEDEKTETEETEIEETETEETEIEETISGKIISGDTSPEETKVSAEYIYVYPPGIPIVAPGEIITKEVAKKIICDYNSGCALIGCVREERRLGVRCIRVV